MQPQTEQILAANTAGLPPEQIAALRKYFEAVPSEEQSFLTGGQGDLKGYLESQVQWWQENGGKTDLSQYGPSVEFLGALGYDVNPAATTTGSTLDPNGMPLEQSLLQQVLPRVTADIAGDAGRQTIADNLAATATQGATAATTALQRTQGGHFDGATYLRQNPDVASAFAGMPDGPTPGTKILNGQPVTADQFSEWHFLNNGQREGRQPSYIQSPQLAQDFNNANQTVASNVASANQAAATNLAALTQATTAMQQNLTGDLAARAAALQTQIATLNQNLTQLDATQRAALATQIASMQSDLEQAVATQRQALTDQITALGGAATAEATARRTSLQQELAGLTAAQAPLAAARTQAAELQATAVNVGLQRTTDQLTADNARAGFVGGSTVQDAALARATVDARQRSAEAIGGARTQNAMDTRDIGVHGATGERSIADALAAAQRDITGQGATGNAALTGALAQGRLGIGNFGSAGTAGIANNTALSRAGIGAQGANTTFQDQIFGATQQRSLSDALAQGQLGITANQAGQTQAAQNQGAAARATYYDNDFGRQLAAGQGLTAIPTNLVSTLTGLGNYANSGTNRALNTLNWWGTNPTTAPTPGALATTAPQTGNAVSNLGAGFFNLGTRGIDWTQLGRPATGSGIAPGTTIIGPGGDPGPGSGVTLGLGR